MKEHGHASDWQTGQGPGLGWALHCTVLPVPSLGPPRAPAPCPDQDPTWRWMKTTEPRSLQVPPWRSTCNIRRIWRKRMPLRRRSLCPHRACPRSPQGEQPAHPHAPLTPLAPPPVRLHALPAPRPPSAPSAQFTDEQTEAPGQAGHSLGPGSERELAQSPPPSTLPQGPSTAGGGGPAPAPART